LLLLLPCELPLPAAANAGGYGNKFVSKAAAKAGTKRLFRRVVNGKLLCARRKAPHMAGQVRTGLRGAGCMHRHCGRART
jgi:hypothetical protein